MPSAEAAPTPPAASPAEPAEAGQPAEGGQAAEGARPSVRAAAQYATAANLSARIAIHAYGTNPQPWFSWLAERVAVAGDVLEVGAGTGELWRHLDASAARLTLTDFSAAMCERLRAVPGARVERCDATALPFADAAFDVVIANHMLYHVDDPAVALAEFARVLRPGGRLYAATNGADHMTDLNAVAAAIGRPDVAVSARQTFTAAGGPPLVARFFGDVAVGRYPCDLAVPSPGPVVSYLDSLAAVPLTPAQRDAARACVDSVIGADGVFRIRKHTVLITGSR
jgi:SAM-dependent methyltransferase